MTFEENSTGGRDPGLAVLRYQELAKSFYQDTGAPDILISGSDEIAVALAGFLAESGVPAGSENWPVITGAGASPAGVR